MIDRFKEISIADIGIGRFQVRKSNTREDLEELAASIKEFGLLHPIVVCRSEGGGTKWEVVAGQRRFLAHKVVLGRDKIIAGIIDRVLSEEEGMALSGNENIHQLAMTRSDLLDLCEQLYKRYRSMTAVWERTRPPMKVVQKYVRYIRLDQSLKDLVDNAGVPEDLALKTQDACTLNGRFDTGRAKELVGHLVEADDELRKRIFEVNSENPTANVGDVVKAAKRPDERLQIGFTMGARAGNALRQYAKEQGATANTTAQDLVESSLQSLGLLKE